MSSNYQEVKRGIKMQMHSKQIYITNIVPCGLWEIFLHTDKTIQKLQKVKKRLVFDKESRPGSDSDQSMLIHTTD